MGGGGISAGCAFGGHFYALEETWHPDLGEPFGVMRCVICHCEPVSAPTHPFPWETPRDPGLLGRGLARREFDSSFQYAVLPMEEGNGIPSASRTPGCPPPRHGGGEGGFKGSGFILPPPPRGWPPAPSLPPSSSPRLGLAGPRTAGREAWGCGEGARVWLPYRHLGTVQGVQGSRWKKMGEVRPCRESMTWHT